MRNTIHLCINGLLVLVLVLLSCTFLQERSSDFDKRVEYCLNYTRTQLKKSIDSIQDADKFPTSTRPDGTWNTRDMYDWRSGHFPGCLWYAFENSSDTSLKEAAIKWMEGLEPVKDYTGNHDVGFMIFCSYGNGYRLTGNEVYREVILQAARSLATRYNHSVGLIQSWNSGKRWRFPVIVDNMMNLELLFWASKNGGDSELYKIAETHALNTMKNHVREDGSTFHVVDFDPESGAVRAKNTSQGYADHSTWSRGQSWGLYGFTMTYRETKNPLFLETARGIADFFIENLPEDSVPYWDFMAPNIPDEPRDTSAAAIAASGLIELSTLVSDKHESVKYYRAALNILSSLCSAEYLSDGTESEGILLHGVGSKPHNSEVDVSLIYGDYYFLEALLRYKHSI